MHPLKDAFNKQKISAKFRGVGWDFSFDEWLQIWEKSGRIELRGKGKGKYVMARFGDIGPYSPSNVEIILCEKNTSDCRTNNPRTLADLRSKQIGTGRGWTFVHGKYQVCVSRKYIGRFKTVEEAESAYAIAANRFLMDAVCAQSVAGGNPGTPGSGRND